MQLLQAVAPEVVEYWPAGQLTQPRPSGEKVPATHATQSDGCEEPSGAEVPGAHVMVQTMAKGAAAEPDIHEPAGQAEMVGMSARPRYSKSALSTAPLAGLAKERSVVTAPPADGVE